MQLPFGDLKIHQDSNSQNGSSLGSVGVHFLTLSYTFGSIKCDSRASLLARTFTSPCISCEPKAKVVTTCTHNYPWPNVIFFHLNNFVDSVGQTISQFGVGVPFGSTWNKRVLPLLNGGM
jgi:hypothetical protein